MSSEKINAIAEQNDIENLFVECVEEVRKDIMKRRLKHEIYNKKKYKLSLLPRTNCQDIVLFTKAFSIKGRIAI